MIQTIIFSTFSARLANPPTGQPNHPIPYSCRHSDPSTPEQVCAPLPPTIGGGR